MEIKQSLAEEAVRIVSGARRSAYGKPEQNFERIARLWNAHMLNTQREGNLTAVDVATFCRLIKEARLAETPDHRDSFVDILGYTLCQAEIALPEVQAPPLTGPQGTLSPDEQDAITKEWADAALVGSLPAWKRAQVGDKVDAGYPEPVRVKAVDDAEGTRYRLQCEIDGVFFWVPNADVVSIVERAV